MDLYEHFQVFMKERGASATHGAGDQPEGIFITLRLGGWSIINGLKLPPAPGKLILVQILGFGVLGVGAGPT